MRGEQVGALREPRDPVRRAPHRRRRAAMRAAAPTTGWRVRPCASANSVVVVQAAERALQQRGQLQVVLRQQQHVAERQQVHHRDVLDQLQAARCRRPATPRSFSARTRRGTSGTLRQAPHQHQDVAGADGAVARAAGARGGSCGRCARPAPRPSGRRRRRPRPAPPGSARRRRSGFSAGRSSGQSSTSPAWPSRSARCSQHRALAPPRRRAPRRRRRPHRPAPAPARWSGRRWSAARGGSRAASSAVDAVAEARLPARRSRARRRPGSRRSTASRRRRRRRCAAGVAIGPPGAPRPGRRRTPPSAPQAISHCAGLVSCASSSSTWSSPPSSLNSTQALPGSAARASAISIRSS